MKKSLIIIILLILVIVVIAIISNKPDKNDTQSELNQPASQDPTPSLGVPAPGFENVPEAVVNTGQNNLDESNKPIEEPAQDVSDSFKELTMTAKKWEFQPNTITVNRGDQVKLSITSIDVSHGISIPQFGISSFLSPGQTTEVEFVADKAGTFSFFCNVSCGVGHGNMRGTLIVQ